MDEIRTINSMMALLRGYGLSPRKMTSSDTGQDSIRFSAKDKFDFAEVICNQASDSGNWSTCYSMDDDVVLTLICTKRTRSSDGNQDRK